MSHPNTNTKAVLDLPPHMFDLVDEEFLERLVLTASEIQRRKQSANPAKPGEFTTSQWKRWLDQRVCV
ncbi:hypothetical protein J9253_07535 [Thiothrix litoralis]|jgi:hypothetical protein|uniref:Uncharacterized protein n=1 Tax=Thiothrix litoralis TaxID=2891210 RepID=A0ABX7WWU6_9GAMM|nr:hypothetical protein [Thiothrix litoralis]QTR47761.1 hypothetical protein J9253_07535 [Thiothrix litoralis]